MPNVIFSCNNLNKVSLKVGQQKHDWLIDTGASVSGIKYEYLKQLQIPYHIEKVKVKGIGGDVFSEGYVYLSLNHNEYNFMHKFLVFKNLPCKGCGILGHDFFKKYRAKLNFESNTLQLITDKLNYVTLTFDCFEPNNTIKCYTSLIAPARSESIHYIETNIQEECVISNQELSEGVFLANSVTRPKNGKVPVFILNTTETEVTISNFEISTTKLKDYFICQFEKPMVNAGRVKTLFSLLNLNELNSEEQKSIKNICAKYPDIFHLPGDKLCTTPIYEQNIDLKPHTSPIYTKPYRLPYSQKSEIDKQIESMLDDGIIEESRSPWSSPLLLVPKKFDSSGKQKWRVVIDYRKLNDKVQDDKFPLPNISEILDSLAGAIYFTHLDLFQGFYQIGLSKHSRPCTAFTTGKNQYQMTRMPMGLKSSPSSFSRMMTIAMSGLNYEKCLVYQDDLVVIGRNLESHNRNLMDIFSRLRKVNLKLNPAKCNFLQKEMLYLGHIVSGTGILPDPEKIRVLKHYPRPQNTEEVKRFVAFANYYRKFIQNFAEVALPLNKLSTKNAQFIWTDNCEHSFETLKLALMNPPILQYPDLTENNEFILQTDASGKAIGSVLCNRDGKPVAYASRSLNKAEINYPTIEKELLAIVWSIKHFRPYLYGKRFKIQTDHRPLVYLFSMRDPSSRLLKFRLQLEEYNFTIEYLKGQSNTVADALSRIKVTSDDLKTMNEQTINVMTRAQLRKINMHNDENTKKRLLTDNNNIISKPGEPRVVDIIKKPNDITELLFRNSKDLNKILRSGLTVEMFKYFIYVPIKSSIYLDTKSRSSIARDELMRDLIFLSKKYAITEICVLRNEDNKRFIKDLTEDINNRKKWPGPRFCILNKVQRINNMDNRRVLLNDFHILPTSGHAGIRRMTNNIKKYYFWPSMTKDIVKYVSECEHCKKQKYSIGTKQPMTITTTANSAFEKVYLDIVGPLQKDTNGYSYVLTLQCELSKYTEAYPLQNKDTVSVARAFVDNFILRYGIPREIATDRGSEFISSTMKEVCSLLKIDQLRSTAYHHESIGALENTHKTMGAYLRINCQNQMGTWSSWLPYWCFAYNNTVHTETNYTPHELVFGKRCILPSNFNGDIVDPLYAHDNYALELKYRLQRAQKDARDNLIQSKKKRKINYDTIVNPVYYKKGDLLLLRNPSENKMDPIFLGPYPVLDDLDCNVKILKNGKEDIVHKNRTKLYKNSV